MHNGLNDDGEIVYGNGLTGGEREKMNDSELVLSWQQRSNDSEAAAMEEDLTPAELVNKNAGGNDDDYLDADTKSNLGSD